MTPAGTLWGELHNNDRRPRRRLVFPSNTVNKTRRRPLRRGPSLRRTAAHVQQALRSVEPTFSSVRTFQRCPRASSTAQRIVPSRVCLGGPRSWLPIRRTQRLWRDNRPLRIPWQPRFLWTYRHGGSIATVGSGSQGVRTANFPDVPNTRLKNAVQRPAIFCLNPECLRGIVCLGTLLSSFAFGESCDASET